MTDSGSLSTSTACASCKKWRPGPGPEIDSLGKNAARPACRSACPPGWANAFIAPLLLQFAERHPGISLRVFFANRVTDLIAAEIDVALR